MRYYNDFYKAKCKYFKNRVVMQEEEEAEKVGLTIGRWAKAQFGHLIMNTLISCLFTWMIFNGKE